MPTYNLENTETGEFTTEFMSWSALENYLAENPHIRQVLSAPPIVSGVVSSKNKPDSGFRDILKTISKRHPRSNVNTF
jgi:hypothetical protein